MKTQGPKEQEAVPSLECEGTRRGGGCYNLLRTEAVEKGCPARAVNWGGGGDGVGMGWGWG